MSNGFHHSLMALEKKNKNKKMILFIFSYLRMDWIVASN